MIRSWSLVFYGIAVFSRLLFSYLFDCLSVYFSRSALAITTLSDLTLSSPSHVVEIRSLIPTNGTSRGAEHIPFNTTGGFPKVTWFLIPQSSIALSSFTTPSVITPVFLGDILNNKTRFVGEGGGEYDKECLCSWPSYLTSVSPS
jgi:hypothetical protein